MPTERITETVAGGVQAAFKSNVPVVLLVAGTTADGARTWSPAALKDAADRKLFDRAKLYLNRRDRAAEARIGHRDVRDWEATVCEGSVKVVGSELRGMLHVHGNRLGAITSDEIARAALGLEVDATVTREGETITRIERVHSVDAVPDTTATGRVTEALGDVREAQGPDAREAAFRARLRADGAHPAQIDALVAARPFGETDEFTKRARAHGLSGDQIDAFRNAR
jgi:hypothetical protein